MRLEAEILVEYGAILRLEVEILVEYGAILL
jgi:hypothetical protein